MGSLLFGRQSREVDNARSSGKVGSRPSCTRARFGWVMARLDLIGHEGGDMHHYALFGIHFDIDIKLFHLWPRQTDRNSCTYQTNSSMTLDAILTRYSSREREKRGLASSYLPCSRNKPDGPLCTYYSLLGMSFDMTLLKSPPEIFLDVVLYL